MGSPSSDAATRAVRFFVPSAFALMFFDCEIALICLFAPLVSLLAWAASYLPESFTFLEANRNAVATGLIALGTIADIALAFLLLVRALKRDRFSVSVFSSVAFAAYAGVHLFASYVFVTLVILE